MFYRCWKLCLSITAFLCALYLLPIVIQITLGKNDLPALLYCENLLLFGFLGYFGIKVTYGFRIISPALVEVLVLSESF